jgi:hypothetical protein
MYEYKMNSEDGDETASSKRFKVYQESPTDNSSDSQGTRRSPGEENGQNIPDNMMNIHYFNSRPHKDEPLPW